MFHRVGQGVSQEATVLKSVKHFIADESGATAIEYGLIAAGISVAIIATLAGIKTNLVSTFTKVQDGLQ